MRKSTRRPPARRTPTGELTEGQRICRAANAAIEAERRFENRIKQTFPPGTAVVVRYFDGPMDHWVDGVVERFFTPAICGVLVRVPDAPPELIAGWESTRIEVSGERLFAFSWGAIDLPKNRSARERKAAAIREMLAESKAQTPATAGSGA